MRIVVVGASGRIGTGVVAALAVAGHEVVAASRRSGVDAVTGDGLAGALSGADAVIDVTRPTTYVDDEVRTFFESVTENLITVELAEGVAHHLALSVVGCDRVPESGYLSAKAAQERLIAGSGMPYTIVRATQFFEFVPHITDTLTHDGVARVPPGLLQPIAAMDVSVAIAATAVERPLGGIIEAAGPERLPMAEFVQRVIDARGDEVEVVTDPGARYFGTRVLGDELVPGEGARLVEGARLGEGARFGEGARLGEGARFGEGARLGATTFEDWLGAHDLRG
ncbi:SDR family oxidoreductase [Agromyces laixinhei]|uniref:SDR family oxidoreductase n=1 Tax=Agromyces laixinhei TaxID=2585717 RepID=UPI0012EDEFC6|nr:SDR family oxidoreductase [Agromyces laixinhei]